MKPLLISFSVVLLASIGYAADAQAGSGTPTLLPVHGKIVCSAPANKKKKGYKSSEGIIALKISTAYGGARCPVCWTVQYRAGQDPQTSRK